MNNTEFGYIYNTYRCRSIAVADTVLKNKAESEDVCQDVFETIYHMGETVDFSDEKKLVSLIIRMSWHKAIDYYRKGYRKYESAGSDVLEKITLKQIPNKDTVDELVMAMETGGYMCGAFEKLRRKNQINYEIYVSIKIYGISPRMIAEHYHMTENNVNNRVSRTKRWLLKEYQKMSQATELKTAYR